MRFEYITMAASSGIAVITISPAQRTSKLRFLLPRDLLHTACRGTAKMSHSFVRRSTPERELSASE